MKYLAAYPFGQLATSSALRVVGALAMIACALFMLAGCSSQSDQPPQQDLTAIRAWEGEVQSAYSDYRRQHAAYQQWLVRQAPTQVPPMAAYQAFLEALAQPIGTDTLIPHNFTARRNWSVLRREALPLKSNAFRQLMADDYAKQLALDSLFARYSYEFIRRNYSYTQLDSIYQLVQSNEGKKIIWEVGRQAERAACDLFYEKIGHQRQLATLANWGNFQQYKLAPLGITQAEAGELCASLVSDIWPLYRELHTFLRHELARRYGLPVPDQLPAQWVEQLNGSGWRDLYPTKLPPIQPADAAELLAGWGWPVALPAELSLIESSRYGHVALSVPLDPQFPQVAARWHLPRDRSAQEWLLGELPMMGLPDLPENPNQPLAMKIWGNPLAHQLIKSSAVLAVGRSWEAKMDTLGAVSDTLALLQQAISILPKILLSIGAGHQMERELYVDNLLPEQYNQRWWELKRQYVGVVPSQEAYNRSCGPAWALGRKMAQQAALTEGLAYLAAFQLHEKVIGIQADSLYQPNPTLGVAWHNLAFVGSSLSSDELFDDFLGGDISAKALLQYFAPLRQYLIQQNANHPHTLPEL